jgi:hypothetical protein
MVLLRSNNCSSCCCPRLRFLLCVPFPSIPDEHRVFAEETGATGKADLAAMKGESGICRYIHRYVYRYSKRANSGITESRTNQGLARTVRRKISQPNETFKNAQCYSAPSTWHGFNPSIQKHLATSPKPPFSSPHAQTSTFPHSCHRYQG